MAKEGGACISIALYSASNGAGLHQHVVTLYRMGQTRICCDLLTFRGLAGCVWEECRTTLISIDVFPA